MTNVPRRHVLTGVAASLPFLAGCVSSFDIGPAAGGDGSTDHDTFQFRYPGEQSEPDVDVHFEAESAMDWLDEHDLQEDADSSASDFVEDTDFDDAVLVSLVAGANDAGYELDVSHVSIDDDALSIDAAVREDSDAGDAVTPTLTTVGAIVRARFEDGPPTEWSVTISDDDGGQHGFGGAVASDSDEGAGEDDDGSDE